MLSDFNADEGHGGWGAEDLEDWWGGEGEGGRWEEGGVWLHLALEWIPHR